MGSFNSREKGKGFRMLKVGLVLAFVAVAAAITAQDAANMDVALQNNPNNGLSAMCAECDNFAPQLAELSAHAYPGGNNVQADQELCSRLNTAEYQSACASFAAQNGGLAAATSFLQTGNQDAICAHLPQCQDAAQAESAMLATSGEEQQANDDEDEEEQDNNSAEDEDEDQDADDEDDDAPVDAHTQAVADAAAMHHAMLHSHAHFLNIGGAANSAMKAFAQSQASQMAMIKQMADTQMQSNALHLHHLETRQPFMSPGCLDKDDVQCNTDPLIRGMNYMMQSNALPQGGLSGDGMGLLSMTMSQPVESQLGITP